MAGAKVPRVYDELRMLCDIHGLFLRKEALRIGCTDRILRRARSEKVIHRVRHGAYAFTDVWESLTERERHVLSARAVLRQAKTQLALSHTTAAVVLGAPLWGVSLDVVHVSRLDHRAGRKEAGVVQHRGVIRDHEIVEVGGLLVTSPTRTALDLTTIYDASRSLPVLDHFLHHKLTTKQNLLVGARAMTRWPNTLGTDLVVTLADGRRESIGESRTFHMMWLGGLPPAEPQFKIRRANGGVIARVDFAWPELGVWLEFDGKEKYTKYRKEGESLLKAVLREKKREERICRLTGWRCIRIVWADLYRPDQTVAYIASVLAGGPVHI